jgi:hypothetical protein
MHIHRRLRVENDRFAVVDFEQSTAKCHATIFATTGYTGGLSWDLTLPDFSGVSGWTALWCLANGVSIEWDLVALAAITVRGTHSRVQEMPPTRLPSTHSPPPAGS